MAAKSIFTPKVGHYGLSILGGSLAAFSFPNPAMISLHWPGGWLAFFCIVPLLMISEYSLAVSPGRCGFIYGLVFFGLATYWIAFMPALHWFAPLVWLLLIGYLSLYPALFMLGYGYLRKQHLPIWSVAPALWIGLEYLRNFMLSGFPWVSLGYAHSQNMFLMPLAPVTGVWGLSLVTVFINVGCYYLLKGVILHPLLRGRRPWVYPGRNAKHTMSGMLPSEKQGDARSKGEPRASRNGEASKVSLPYIFIWLLVAGMMAGGIVYEKRILQGDGHPKLVWKIAALQGSVNQDQLWDDTYQKMTFQRYSQLLQQAVQAKARLAIWPETAFPGIFNLDRPLANEVESWSRFWRINQIIGSDLAIPDLKEGYKYYNAILLIDEQGRLQGQSAKKHLVPFGEYVPFKDSFLVFVHKIVRRYGGAGFTPSEERKLLPLVIDQQRVPVGALICFESLFPEYAAGLTRQGAQLLVMITYDTWFGQTSAPAQHAIFSAFRAAENSRYLIRVGASGISCLFDPQGKMISSMGLNRIGVLVGEIAPLAHLTLYTRWGDWLAWFCCLWVLLCFLPYNTASTKGACQ